MIIPQQAYLFGAAYLFSIYICRILIKFGPKDAPDNERKVQAIAIPTSGGLAIVSAMVIPLILLFAHGEHIQIRSIEDVTYFSSWNIFLDKGGGYFAALSLMALGLGALDDRFALPAKLKLLVFASFTLIAARFGTHVDGIVLPVADAYFPIAAWLGIGGTALWLFVFMNAANFMDGSNGLAMGTLAIMIAAIAYNLISPHLGLHQIGSDPLYLQEWMFVYILNFIGGITIFAILGFLFWNLQGKLYAGDAGSLFGGAVFASLGVYAARNGNIWFPATLALPFLVDVFMTLIWRAKQRHNLLTPHRHHAYQLFIRSGWSHIKTALLWWSLAAVCALAALLAAGDSQTTSAWVFFALLGAGCLLWFVQRRIYLPKATA